MEPNQLFRAKSLERLNSPEQLDQVMKVTNPKAWLSLMALGSIIVFAVIWSVVGNLPTKVNGQGILIKEGGIPNIISTTTGVVTEISVKPGDFVRRGQVVARVSQGALARQKDELLARYNESVYNLNEFDKNAGISKNLSTDEVAKRKENLSLSITNKKEQIKIIKEKIKVQHELLKDGLIIRGDLLNTQGQLKSTQEQIANFKLQLKQLDVKKNQSISNMKTQRSALEQKVSASKRSLEDIMIRIRSNKKVISNFNGKVLEIKANEGGMIKTGQPIISVEKTGNDADELIAVLFIPAKDGNKIRSRMKVQVSPSTVKKEEFGYMLGVVKSVTPYAASSAGMEEILGNSDVVSTFMQDGAPIIVYVSLVPNAKTASGYKWSSQNGPDAQVYSGTLCSSSIIIKNDKPISLVIPKIREFLGF